MQDKVEQILRNLTLIAEPLLAMADSEYTDYTAARQSHDAVLAYLDQFHEVDLIDATLASAAAKALRHRLIFANSQFHSTVEKTKARNYLASNNIDPFEGSWINKGFGDLLKGQLAQWDRCGVNFRRPGFSIAVVGGGALPQTQVFLHRAIGARVVAIDRDPEAVDLCTAVLRRLGMGHLGVETADGALQDYSGFDVVIVATLVFKKEDIGLRVASGQKNAFFSPRIPIRMHRMWREAIDLTVLREALEVVDTFVPDGSSVGSLLLRPTKRP